MNLTTKSVKSPKNTAITVKSLLAMSVMKKWTVKSMTREEAIERLMYLRDEIMPISSTMFGALTMAIQALEEQPKTGKWIFDGDCYKCNKCGAVYGWWADSQTSKYCPNCGCRMLKEGDTE